MRWREGGGHDMERGGTLDGERERGGHEMVRERERGEDMRWR